MLLLDSLIVTEYICSSSAHDFNDTVSQMYTCVYWHVALSIIYTMFRKFVI